MPGVEALVPVIALSPFSVSVVQSDQDFDLFVSEFSEHISAVFSSCPFAVPQVVLLQPGVLSVRLKVSVDVDDGSSRGRDGAEPWPAQKETGFACAHQPLLCRVLIPLEGGQLAWLFLAPGQLLLLVFAQGWGCRSARSGHCPRSSTVGTPRSLLPSAGRAPAPVRSWFPLVPQGFCWLLLTVLT